MGTDPADGNGPTSSNDEQASVSGPTPEVDPDIDPNYQRYVIKLGQIEVVIEPGRTREWGEFCENAPPNSIALDGYVKGKPEVLLFPPQGPKANFNHHEDVVRFATSCTADQTLRAIKDNLDLSALYGIS